MKVDSSALVLAMHKCKMSQTELARQSGITRETISRIINGKVENVNQATINRLARGLDIPSSALVCSSKEKKLLKELEKKANHELARKNHFWIVNSKLNNFLRLFIRYSTGVK